MHSSMRDDRLAVLLPVTSKRTAPDLSEGPDAQTSAAGPVLAGLQCLADSLIVSNPALQDDTATSSAVFVLFGIDSDDDVLMLQQKAMLRCFEAVGVTAEVMVFSEADRAGHPPGAVCYLWGLLAAAAVKKGYNLAVLLGTYTQPGICSAYIAASSGAFLSAGINIACALVTVTKGFGTTNM
jgi:hypothetical protein